MHAFSCSETEKSGFTTEKSPHLWNHREFFPRQVMSQRSYGVNFGIGSRLCVKQESKNRKTSAGAPISDRFSRNIQESLLSKPSNLGKNSRKIGNAEENNNKKKSAKMRDALPFFFNPQCLSKAVDEFREKFHISLTNANFFKIFFSPVA